MYGQCNISWRASAYCGLSMAPGLGMCMSDIIFTANINNLPRMHESMVEAASAVGHRSLGRGSTSDTNLNGVSPSFRRISFGNRLAHIVCHVHKSGGTTTTSLRHVYALVIRIVTHRRSNIGQHCTYVNTALIRNI